VSAGINVRLFPHRHARIEPEDDGGGIELLAWGWDFNEGDVLEDVDGDRYTLVSVSSYIHTDSPRGNYITASMVPLRRGSFA
jgi:hypothetical protein